MRVNFVVRTKSQIKQGIEDGSIHFGLVNIHESTAINSFNSTVLGHIEFCPFVQKESEFAKLPSNRVLAALRTGRQIVLKGLVDEGLKDKILLSANHEDIDELSLVIKMVQEGVGWSFLPKVMSDPITNDLQQVYPDQLTEGFKFAIALWSPHSKQIAIVRKVVVETTKKYIERYKMILKTPEK
jgi:DNA-binding transcriptional LysR family regulator